MLRQLRKRSADTFSKTLYFTHTEVQVTPVYTYTAGDLLDYTDKYILPSLAALIIYNFASCDGR